VPTLADVVAALDRRYDPAWAEEWDAVGLVCGDPDQPVRRVLLAVDPVEVVASEAIAGGVDLLVTHHPLFLGGTTSVAATTSKGRLVHRLVGNGCALFVAHTNADVASPGVSDALAAALGLVDVQPLSARAGEPLDKIMTFAPAEAVEALLDAMAAAGAGVIGDYSRCAFLVDGIGTFRPGTAAQPTVGEPGETTRADETKIEVVAPRARRDAVLRALVAAHPYEEPAWDVVELASRAGPRGLGRVGELAETTDLASFTRHVAAALPATAWGVRAAGDERREVRRVAVCGGSGGDLVAAAAAAGADVLVTSDLKHHATSEALADTGVALVDAAHWATEWPWLRAAAAALVADLGVDTVEATVSTTVTDPWTLHAMQREQQKDP
jgi:dinuclear metal center YbgI/SA1388 family protein